LEYGANKDDAVAMVKKAVAFAFGSNPPTGYGLNFTPAGGSSGSAVCIEVEIVGTYGVTSPVLLRTSNLTPRKPRQPMLPKL
jgi:hypothetical protein